VVFGGGTAPAALCWNQVTIIGWTPFTKKVRVKVFNEIPLAHIILPQSHHIMPTKLSEKKLFIGIALFCAAIFLITKATLFAGPVQVSEQGLLFIASGILLLGASAWVLRRAIVKI
jgi:hypothetical protein